MNELDKNINKDLILREMLALQRTELANHSTLLAFVRTALYFLVAGLSLRSLFKLENSLMIEVLFFIISSSILIIGILNYFKQLRKIKISEKHIGDYKLEFLNK
jgi:putative membrane protein